MRNIGLTLLWVLALITIGYFLPTAVAATRRHHNTGAILVTNIFAFLWGIPWVIALVWACTKTERTA